VLCLYSSKLKSVTRPYLKAINLAIISLFFTGEAFAYGLLVPSLLSAETQLT
jgi:hypothetical protein